MRSLGVILATVSGLFALVGCGAPSGSESGAGTDDDIRTSSQALETETVTTTTRVIVVCSESSAGQLFFDLVHPVNVAENESFSVSLTVRDFLISQAPFSGTLSSSETLLASGAAPPESVLTLATFHFPAGEPILNIGTAATLLTASGSAGSGIVLSAGPFDYTIVPDSPSIPPIVGHCIPPTDTPSLATIPIVRLPATKGDCKHGGWASLTDAAGQVFDNQGRCEKVVRDRS